jgi:hypothetical protein
LFCAQRFLFASHSEKLAISIRRPFFERSVFYSRDILKSSRSLFARLPLCAAFSVREPFWKARDLYLHAFLWALRLVFFGCVQWIISIVVLYISLSLCMGEKIFRFKKTFCLMNVWPQDLLSHDPTLCFRRHQLFGLGSPSF